MVGGVCVGGGGVCVTVEGGGLSLLSTLIVCLLHMKILNCL